MKTIATVTLLSHIVNKAKRIHITVLAQRVVSYFEYYILYIY